MQIRPIHIVKHQKTFGKEESTCVLKRIHRYSSCISHRRSAELRRLRQRHTRTDCRQGKDFQTAKAAVAAAPDIREELTAPIKARIQNGTYGVDNASFAEKLLQKQEEMR